MGGSNSAPLVSPSESNINYDDQQLKEFLDEHILCRVPHGTELGEVLFSLYVGNLVKEYTKTKTFDDLRSALAWNKVEDLVSVFEEIQRRELTGVSKEEGMKQVTETLSFSDANELRRLVTSTCKILTEVKDALGPEEVGAKAEEYDKRLDAYMAKKGANMNLKKLEREKKKEMRRVRAEAEVDEFRDIPLKDEQMGGVDDDYHGVEVRPLNHFDDPEE